eukprot:2876725-Prymnesium_polylepis.1
MPEARSAERSTCALPERSSSALLHSLTTQDANLAELAKLDWAVLNERLKALGVGKMGHRLKVSELLRAPGGVETSIAAARAFGASIGTPLEAHTAP